MQDPKNRHLGTIAQLCRAISSQQRHVSTIGKKLVKQQYLLRMPHNMVNFGLLAAEIVSLVWASQLTSKAFASWLRYCSDVAQRKPAKLCTVFGRLLGWYTTYAFSGVLVPLRNFARCKIIFASSQVLRCRILVALLHGTWTVGASRTLRCWAQGATYIWEGDHHVGHDPHTKVKFVLLYFQIVGYEIVHAISSQRYRDVVSRPWSWSRWHEKWSWSWSWSWNKSLGLGLGLDEKVSTFSRPWWMIIQTAL